MFSKKTDEPKHKVQKHNSKTLTDPQRIERHPARLSTPTRKETQGLYAKDRAISLAQEVALGLKAEEQGDKERAERIEKKFAIIEEAKTRQERDRRNAGRHEKRKTHPENLQKTTNENSTNSLLSCLDNLFCHTSNSQVIPTNTPLSRAGEENKTTKLQKTTTTQIPDQV